MFSSEKDKKGAQPFRTTRYQRFVLFNPFITLQQACKEGNLRVVRFILSQNLTDINVRGEYGRTPAMVAALNGHKTVFSILVRHGCDLLTVDETSSNVFHLACLGGHLEVVRYILSKEMVELESRTSHGSPPAMYAAYHGHLAVLKYLQRKGCNMTAVDNEGLNILHFASKGGSLDVVDYILSQHILDVECLGYEGRTPVMYAVMANQIAVVEHLRSLGCNMAAVDTDGKTLLDIACCSGHVNMVKYMLSNQTVDINSLGSSGYPPVVHATASGKTSVVKYLRGKGCNMTAVDKNGNNILHWACMQGHVDTIQYILSQQIVDIDSRGSDGRTPVFYAAYQGYVAVVKYLKHQGCTMTDVDSHGNSMLHVACMGGHVNMVKYLVTFKSLKEKRDEINEDGQTPSNLAVIAGHPEVVELC